MFNPDKTLVKGDFRSKKGIIFVLLFYCLQFAKNMVSYCFSAVATTTPTLD